MTSSRSKVPASDQKSLIPVKAIKISPDNPPNTSTVKQEASQQDTNRQRAGDTPINNSALKSTEDPNTGEENKVVRATKSTSSANNMKGKQPKTSEAGVSSSNSEDIVKGDVSLVIVPDSEVVGQVVGPGAAHSPAAHKNTTEAESQGELDQTKPQTKVEIPPKMILCTAQKNALPWSNQVINNPTADILQEERVTEPSPARLSQDPIAAQQDISASSAQTTGLNEDLKKSETAEKSQEELCRRAEGLNIEPMTVGVGQPPINIENKPTKEKERDELERQLDFKPNERLTCDLEVKSSPLQSFREVGRDITEASGSLDADERGQQLVSNTHKEGTDTHLQSALDENEANIMAVGQDSKTHITEGVKNEETVKEIELEKPTLPPDDMHLNPEIPENTQQVGADALEMHIIDVKQEPASHMKERADVQQDGKFKREPISVEKTERLSDVPVKELNATLHKSTEISGCTTDKQSKPGVVPEMGIFPDFTFLCTEAQGADNINKNSKAWKIGKSLPDTIVNEKIDIDVCKQEIPLTATLAASNTEKKIETINHPGKTGTGSSFFQRDTTAANSVHGKKAETEKEDGRTLADDPVALNGTNDVSFRPEEKSRGGPENKLSMQNNWQMNTSNLERTFVNNRTHKSDGELNKKLPDVQGPHPNSSDVEKSADDEAKANSESHTERKRDPINLSDEQKLANSDLTATVKTSSPSDSTDGDEGIASCWIDGEHLEKEKNSKSNPVALTSKPEHLESDGVKDFIKSIKEGSIPFSQPLKKHGHKKAPLQLPAIKENHFEKTFDPEGFHFGIRKDSSISRGPSPAMAIKNNAANRKRAKREPLSNSDGSDQAVDPLKPSDETIRKGDVRDTNIEAAGKEQPMKGQESGGRFGRMSILSNLLTSPLKSKEKIKNGTLYSLEQEDCLSHGKQGLDSPLQGGEANNEVMRSKGQGPTDGASINTVSYR